jgi:predicted O-methyltransferase YrrM
MLLTLVRPGGLIMPSTTFSGRDESLILTVQDNRTNKIRAFNDALYHDNRVTLSLLPLADGLTLAMKRP